MKKKVVISGGTGFVGVYLTSLLVKKGYEVLVLSRTLRPNTAAVSYYLWDVSSGTIDEKAILEADYIVHLAGESIGDTRWTAARKKAILESRVQSTTLIGNVLKSNAKKVQAFISASGIGIYGALNGKGICTEETQVGHDFLGKVCEEWEKAADGIASLGIRTVKIRTGLVLGNKAGFLQKMIPIFKKGLGAPLGSGKQFMPWIHIHDLCAIYLEAIENDQMEGAYNATIEDSTTNSLFTKTLASVYNYSVWLPNIPAFVLELILGEMAVIVLTGRRISNHKLLHLGFRFHFKSLEAALQDCVKSKD
ncbi:TIGR01777 family oxidoreductase [Flavobacterium sp. TSSA_36]|uniref:TIGR01777 family oxidoreductase n=1 Tax=Flavobacterium sp. TSSA_36 TaxID=3447669 RepID=UPI003F2F6416